MREGEGAPLEGPLTPERSLRTPHSRHNPHFRPPTPEHQAMGGFIEHSGYCLLLKAGKTPDNLHILAQAGTGAAPPSSVPLPPRHSSWRVRMKSVTRTAASSCSLVSGSGKSPCLLPDSRVSS